MLNRLEGQQKERLKNIISDHLKSTNVYGQVRSFVRDFLESEEGMDINEDKLLTTLHEKRVVEEVLNSLGREHGNQLSHSSTPTSALAKKAGGKFLHVRLKKGRGFVDHLHDASCLRLHAFFFIMMASSQRHASKPVPCDVEPNFDDTFLFHLPGNSDRPVSALSSPIHMVVTQQGSDDRLEIIGTQEIEWRKVLVSGRLSIDVELMGLSGDSTVAVGLLGLQLELLPKSHNLLADEVSLEQVIKAERESLLEHERRFFNSAKIWWKEFLQIRPEHGNRMVKIFARFVSLIEFSRMQPLGSGRGDVEEHAILLCNLLLGFRFEAYCVIGTTLAGDPHMWVATLERDLELNKIKVTFWESLTGSRYSHGGSDSPSVHKYGKIGCVFNHESFYANVQPDDSVRSCSFDLNNMSHWKAMDSAAVREIRRRKHVPELSYYPLSTHMMEEVLEQSLRDLISKRRGINGLATHWDEELCQLLSPALTAYEAERVYGSASGLADFQQSIRNAVPDDFSFKGFPIQFCHLSAPRMLEDLLRAKAAAEIVSLQGGVDRVRFAVRSHVVVYPERVCAVWVMLAVVYARLED
ncbi:hypothetical protein GUITHDRAFT_118642 [Guillardia theta CCMP2712]|uniref:Uncharacterized protein n=1 Tax=Guillardia theta (strain CCMP2712) TaxID=905079 RepID=L1IH00_GUITC|nr:hypothetical protein GUITHDRAFT_118642 [Guillardia theta CCMP2712]EKX35199.1 hypothetical protein GUITHDRAFT_118642 [Guillardia theta CCMP2712]|eukprot:XP_005822179.1 hypothetical protein GUITHDRAFT_118642 [Guillardia theta CCMP2712]